MSARSILAAVAVLAPMTAVPAVARAQDPDGVLPRLPAHAAPGVCYARVRAPARFGPPGPATARWRLTPPPPGAPGPLWCLVTEPGAPPAVVAPERSGWIRVLCDADATPGRIRGLQHRLHERGMYEGEESGRYDGATAAAVGRFQSMHGLRHGGYLSLRTMEALEGDAAFAGPAPPLPQAPAYAPPPPPPPVVYLQAPAPPASPWLSWPGKTRY